jgi:hypothetical protein
VADKLYDGFVADLKAAGIEVVPQSELDANANFQEIRKAGTASPFIDNIETGVRKDKHMAVNMLVSAKGLPIILNGLIDKKWLPGDGGQSLRGMTLVLGSATAAKTLQAPLLAVRMTVSMIEQKGKGWGSSAQYGNMILKSASWEFETDPLPRFVEDGTAIFVNGVKRRVAQRRVALPADRIDRLEQLGRQGGAPGVQVFVQLRQRGHADDGAGHAATWCSRRPAPAAWASGRARAPAAL